MAGYKKKLYREEALTAAMELNYGKEVLNAIKEAKTDDEISQIMSIARNGGCKK